MELDKLKSYVDFMKEHQLCELEIEQEGERIKLKKDSYLDKTVMPQGHSSMFDKPVVEKDITKRIEIKSPMVGTFYRAPSPGAKPYVELEEIIKPGDVVCIVEAMKLMNEIKAEVGGKIVEAAVENGEAVEFGQTLFYIEGE